ncbi:interleukin-12 receptor subunit beta-1 isoform X1 [Dipodomys merriami]|uniref:interleukin-12 receptor subunit beta-1 isoform X1 n=1 Tax=Dipodomys merriami TaxID=94247 RepID=UPI003855C504
MGLPAAGLHLLSLLVLSQQGASCPDRGCCFQELPPPSAAPNPGLSADSDWGPTDLSCYRTPGHGYQCSWRYEGPTAQLRHFLRCCMHDACGSRCCCYFEAAAGATRVQFSEQDGVSVLSSVSLWVESRVGNRTARSPELRLRLYRWVRYDPPDREAIAVSRTGQTLRLEWEAQVEADAVQAQLRRRTPRGDWQQADCGPQDEAGPESCPCPLLPDAAQEIQVRRRRLERSGAAGGPWSSWSGPVCVPRGDLRAPDVSFVAEPLGLDGTRLVSVREQPPEPEQPEGCRDVASGARVSHWVRVRMRSCGCRPQPASEERLARGLRLSGAAYDLDVFSRSRFGAGPPQKWALPARDPAGRLELTAGAGAGDAALRWPARAPGTTYCLEWRPHARAGPAGAPAHCELTAPLDGGPAGVVSLRWAPPGPQCYRVAVFASERPDNASAWASVASRYLFWGNHLAAGAPRQVRVSGLDGAAPAVSWTNSTLADCPGALLRYVVHCGDDAGSATELQVKPPETRVTLHGLRAGALYTVQVRADSAWMRGAWSPPQRFRLGARQTAGPPGPDAEVLRITAPTPARPSPPEPETPHASIVLASLGSFVGILLLGALGYLGLSRALWHLCPPLPTPYASTAVEFPGSQGKQAWPWADPGGLPEEAHPAETLVVMAWDEADAPEAPEGTGASEARVSARVAGLPLLLADRRQGARDGAGPGPPRTAEDGRAPSASGPGAGP